MRIVQRLIGRDKSNLTETKYDDTMGLLTKEDIKKLREATLKPRSPHRKLAYSTWICSECGYGCFYKVIRCQICESDKVQEVVQPTKYELMYGGITQAEPPEKAAREEPPGKIRKAPRLRV